MLAKLITQSHYTHLLHGSLPFSKAAQAVRFVLDRPYIIPFWPELPALGAEYLMLERRVGYGHPGWDGLVELKRVLKGRVTPLVKGQLAGPLTRFMFGGISSVAEALQLTCQELVWQIEELSRIGNKVLLVLDEPAFQRWHEVGNTLRKQVLDSYSYLYVVVSDRGASLGIHSCAALVPELLELPIELYSFELLQTPAPELAPEVWQAAACRGLVLAPGIWSAVGGSEQDVLAGEGVFDDFRANVARDVVLLKAACCGHAGSNPAWVEHLYGLL